MRKLFSSISCRRLSTSPYLLKLSKIQGTKKQYFLTRLMTLKNVYDKRYHFLFQYLFCYIKLDMFIGSQPSKIRLTTLFSLFINHV